MNPLSQSPRIRGRKWMETRARILSRDCGLCQECRRKGILTSLMLATCITDHIIALSNGGSNDDDNLQSLCHSCNETKTAADLGHKQRVTIGADGWPIEEASKVPVWKRAGYR